ncbi:sensor histidine kinase [Niallia sp. BSM11]|uniref:sensor histidine kinase n=1 Tax=Niallia sp. BSM11 TaxID=3391576 RepID=UPI0039848EBD
MNKKAKQISNYLALRFFIMTLSCFVIIFLLSFILVSVNDSQALSGVIGDAVKWTSNRLLLLAPSVFIACVFIILIIQRRQLITYLVTLSANLETITIEEKHDLQLPPILKDAEEGMERLRYELKEKERAAKEAEQRKNDLIVYLAHDLKTPISSIIGYLTLLRDEKNLSDEMYQKFIHVTMSNAERLDDLINEFFEITRFNLSAISLHYSKVNLSFMLEQLLFEFQPILRAKNLTYRIEDSQHIEIACDAEKIQRVFDNLVSNAVHYSFEDSEIVISITQDEDSAVIQFSNEGYPIERDKLDRLFEQFYRLDAARSTRSGGAGIGLAIAKQIMEQHHGTITASSNGQKINFTVKLPLS